MIAQSLHPSKTQHHSRATAHVGDRYKRCKRYEQTQGSDEQTLRRSRTNSHCTKDTAHSTHTTAAGSLLSRKSIIPCSTNEAGDSPGCTRHVRNTIRFRCKVDVNIMSTADCAKWRNATRLAHTLAYTKETERTVPSLTMFLGDVMVNKSTLYTPHTSTHAHNYISFGSKAACTKPKHTLHRHSTPQHSRHMTPTLPHRLCSSV